MISPDVHQRSRIPVKRLTCRATGTIGQLYPRDVDVVGQRSPARCRGVLYIDRLEDEFRERVEPVLGELVEEYAAGGHRE